MILNATFSGVREEIEKFESGGHSPQSVKAHIELDSSGILKLSEVNLIMSHDVLKQGEGSSGTLKRKILIHPDARFALFYIQMLITSICTIQLGE